MAAHVKRRDYEDRVDSEYGFRALKAQLDIQLEKRSLASSAYHNKQLPDNLVEEIIRRYSIRGWTVGCNVGDGTAFSFTR